MATAASELQSVADITADHDDSVMTTTSVATQGGRKAAKPRKAAATKGRKTRAKKDGAVEVMEDDQDAEPQPPSPAKSTRGRKRASDAMEDSVMTNAEAPAPKKRATRGRASNNMDASALTTISQDTEMADAPPAKRPTGRKKGRASNTKTTRKASSSSLRSQASTASLRAHVPDDDDELDRQLQADLERPLTDDEGVAADSDSERKKVEPAPAKGRPRKGTTSKKAVPQSQEEQVNAYDMFNPVATEPDDADIDAELMALEAEMNSAGQAETLEIPKKGRKAGTRKASKQTKKAKEPAQPPPEPVEEPAEEEEVALVEAAPAPAPVPESDATENHDTSSGTVVTKSRTSVGKKPRGRPPKKSRVSQPVDEKPDPPPVPVHAKPEATSVATPESPPPPKQTSEKVASHTPTGPTPIRTGKALPPPPPPFSITRKPAAQPQTPSSNRVTATPSAKQPTLSPSQSPQSSDAENQPPSSKPSTSAAGPAKRVVLAPVAVTPVRCASPSRRNVVAGLRSTAKWAAADLDAVFASPDDGGVGAQLRKNAAELSTPEKRMTVEEWVYHNAGLAEQKLRHECEAMVSSFEREGTKAMGVLEGLVVD